MTEVLYHIKNLWEKQNYKKFECEKAHAACDENNHEQNKNKNSRFVKEHLLKLQQNEHVILAGRWTNMNHLNRL